LSLEKLDIIETELKKSKIDEYEIYLLNDHYFETLFLKNQIENEREGKNFEYIIRILYQQKDQTGIGVIKGNSLNLNDIKNNINFASLISKQNVGSKYHFPDKNTYQEITVAEKRILQDPNGVKTRICKELLTLISEQKNVTPTFGRFRIHINDISLKNSNGLNLNTKKTHFFVEFALKAQNSAGLSEYWPVLSFKDQDQLRLEERVKTWAKYAYDGLKAKPPIQNEKAIVIFSPQLIENALSPVLEFHSSGKMFHEKMSQYNVDKEVTSHNLTILDNGLMLGGLHTNSWDGEGNPHQTTLLVKDGIFKNRIYDQKYALLENRKSTGNGVRTADGAVTNGISNIEILPGKISLEEMISEIKTGYYIDNCAWLRPSEITGEFGTLIKNGYYIENGTILYPIQGGNVSGNVHKMLKECLFISKERDFAMNCLLPYMAFSNLTISY
jgi:PmbA protein